MKKVRSLVAFLVAALPILALACAPAEPGATTSPGAVPPASPSADATAARDAQGTSWGVIEIRVTDPPPADVKKAVVFLSSIEVHRASDNATGFVTDNVSEWVSDAGGEWITVVGAPPSFDLMDVIGVSALLGSANVTPGKYTQIRMAVTKVEVTTVAGDNFTAEIPSGELKIVRPFDVQSGVATVLTLDFDGEKSLIVTGKGKAIFKPVVRLLVEPGKAAEAGKPAETGKPAQTGKPADTGKPTDTGKPARY